MRVQTSRPLRIGLLGMYTNHNLGDTAIVREMMKEIGARLPGSEFIGICRTPEEAAQIHGISAVPSSGYGAAFHADGTRWHAQEHPAPKWLGRGVGTRRIVTVARTLDLLVMTGGGQIEDFFGGPGSQPRALFTWILVSRVFGVPTALFGVGVDQLLHRWSRILSVNAIRLADLRSFREAGSVDLLREWGLRGECRVDPDPALGIDAQRFAPERWVHDNLVVVSPISYRTWTEVREASYDSYLKDLAKVCGSWLREGRHIRFVCSDIQMDPPVADQVMSSLPADVCSRAEFVNVKTVDEFLESVASARFVVASRLHGVILSLVAGTPVIAISPARKVTRLMSDSGLGEYCIELPSMSVEGLRATAARVEDLQVKLRTHIAALTLQYRSDLAQAYDELVGLLQRKSRLRS